MERRIMFRREKKYLSKCLTGRNPKCVISNIPLECGFRVVVYIIWGKSLFLLLRCMHHLDYISKIAL